MRRRCRQSEMGWNRVALKTTKEVVAEVESAELEMQLKACERKLANVIIRLYI